MRYTIISNKRLLFTVLLALILFVTATGIFFLWRTQSVISQSVFNHLEGMRDIKKSAVQDYFKERQKNMQIMVDIISELKAEALSNLVIVCRKWIDTISY